jgi:putative lipoic acid-binding regulatory protein
MRFAQAIVELCSVRTGFRRQHTRDANRRRTATIIRTATIRATSREQLDDLYRALTSHPLVKVVCRTADDRRDLGRAEYLRTWHSMREFNAKRELQYR